MPKPQNAEHKVLKRIRYHNPNHPLGGTLVEAGEILPFPHIDDTGYQLLLRKKYIAPLERKPKPQEKPE